MDDPNWQLKISYESRDKTLSLYVESAARPMASAYSLIELIGKRFNDALEKGQFQSHFVAFDRIR